MTIFKRVFSFLKIIVITGGLQSRGPKAIVAVVSLNLALHKVVQCQIMMMLSFDSCKLP